jgi:beta-mannosidase
MTNKTQDMAAGGSRSQLAGTWRFRKAGDADWLPATVPGSNVTDLLRQGVIGDPFHRDNENHFQWIEAADWEYECRFDLPAGLDGADELALLFDGLDTHATVSLNGQQILVSDNMFHRHRVPCGPLLRAGENLLRVYFQSPVTRAAALQARDGFLYPAENDKTPMKASVYSRKAPYHFGWDWGPKQVPSGIWRPIWVEAVRQARLGEFAYHLIRLADDVALVELRLGLEGLKPGAARLEIMCEQPGVEPIALDLDIHPGLQEQRLVIRIDQPRRWWPNGLGEAFLYRFHLCLRDAQGNELDRMERAIGLRTIEVVNQPDEQGLSFYLKVNGRPTFMKGANYIPPDSFLENMSPERYRQLFRDCVGANYNMLRVWGGGTYEDDLFYDLADQNGILIWQDFMFSCTLYPSDPAFMDSVAVEAEQAVKRLRHHACLALWCGNNEISMGIDKWDWPAKFGYSPEQYSAMVAGNSRLFDELLPGIVAAHDAGRFYVASSPIGYWEHADEDGKGDGHYWGVWHGELPFATYDARLSRFMSEYGFQSYPLLPSVERFTDPEDRSKDSAVMGVHQKHPRGNAIISRFIAQHFGEPASFGDFCYLGQMVQADGLRVAFEAHRRNMPFCMGSLYWQINDCWPAISWSSIDYYGRWKALHYQAARSFAPLILSVTAGQGGLDIHAISDLMADRALVLHARLIDLYGGEIWSAEQAVTVPANSSTLLARLDPPAQLDKALLVLRLLDGAEQVTRHIHPLTPLLAADLPEPGLTLAACEDGGVEVRAERYARGVLVLADPLDGGARALNFSDNFFDLLPGEVKRIHPRDGRAFDPASLRVMSVHGSTEKGK